MDFEVENIPVTMPDGSVVGKARLTEDDYGVIAHITFDAAPGLIMRDAAEGGSLTGFSIGTEITPVTIKQGPPSGRLGEEEINNRFGFHKAKIEGPNPSATEHAAARIEFMNFAKWLDKNLPACREKSVAFTELESASMWAHKAIARLDWPR